MAMRRTACAGRNATATFMWGPCGAVDRRSNASTPSKGDGCPAAPADKSTAVDTYEVRTDATECPEGPGLKYTSRKAGMWVGAALMHVPTRADTKRKWLAATAAVQAALGVRKSEER